MAPRDHIRVVWKVLISQSRSFELEIVEGPFLIKSIYIYICTHIGKYTYT